MIPPALLYLRIQKRSQRGWGLWLPIILFWPFLLLACVLAMPFLAVASLIKGGRLPPGLILLSYRTLCSWRGFSCHVADGNHEVSLRII